MGRGRKGISTQGRKNMKTNRRLNMKREANIVICHNKQPATTKINLQEDVLEFMEDMNPQQLVDFLLPNERIHHQDSQMMDFPFEKLYNQLGENDDFLRPIFYVTFDFSKKKKKLCMDENRRERVLWRTMRRCVLSQSHVTDES